MEIPSLVLSHERSSDDDLQSVYQIAGGDMKLEFKPEDFLSNRPIDKEIRNIFPEWEEIIVSLAEHHAKAANARLREMLAEYLDQAPRVFGSVEFGWWSEEPQPKHEEAHHVDTHHARLVCIEPIGKESGE
jgi:hypothetical protein